MNGPIERFLFAKVELWLLLLTALIGLACMIGFGTLVDRGLRSPEQSGHLERLAVRIAHAPSALFELRSYQPPQQARESRFEGQAGLSFASGAGAAAEDGYLLLSRYDSQARRFVVELVDLNRRVTIHRYAPDIAALNALSRLDRRFVNLERDKAPDRYRMVHPFLTADGGLIFQDDSPLVAIDVCSNVKWTLDGVFHHSIEQDADGNFWAPETIWPPVTEGVAEFFLESGITQISPQGRVLFRRSIAQILSDNGMRHLVFGRPYLDDPFHLNDIQPVLSDGPYWRRGDLFLSLRHLSMVLLYRPSTNRIIWSQQGPWSFQHDVSVVDDHTISVFNNNTESRASGEVVNGTNDLVSYDFSTGRVYSPFRAAFQALDIRTVTEGRGAVLANGDAFVEETDYGRIVRLSPAGQERWRYVNAGERGAPYLLGWSRYLDGASYRAVVSRIQAAQCGGSRT